MLWKIAIRHAVLATTLALPLTMAFGQGCGQAHDVCDRVCECTRCSDRTRDNCLIEFNRMVEVAAAYDCSDDMDKYVACIVSDSDCKDTRFSADDCQADEQVDLLKCMDDSSDYVFLGSTGAIGEGEGEGPPAGAGGAMTGSGGTGGAGGAGIGAGGTGGSPGAGGAG